MKDVRTNPNLPASPETRGKEFSTRLFFLKLGLFCFFLLIAARLVKIQVIEAARFQAIARKQHEQTFRLPAMRGSILDRNGNVLVSNTIFVSFAADPKIATDHADRIADKFAGTFKKPASAYLSKLRNAAGSKRFVWLERHVEPGLARLIETAELPGTVAIQEPKRLYHYDDLAGPLLGLTDIDNRGIAGLELQYQTELSGTDGSITMQRDGLGRTRPSADYPRISPVNGYNMVLTLDLAYQSIVEEELRRGVAVNRADGGLAIMLSPKTGEILALATVPSINPNQFTSNDLSAAKNRPITDLFEPGSVFKIVTAAAAYENGLVTPEKRFNAENGLYRIRLGGGLIRQIRDTHEHDWLTFQEAIEVSSNIVMAKISGPIGAERFYRQARDFGFGIPTGIELPGEVRGRLKKPHEWSGTTLHTMSYGYEVSVTPLQIAAAYAAIANRGTLMRPFIVSQIRTEDADIVQEQGPQKIRNVISEETALLITQALEGAVERGTAKEVKIHGVRIAGKTGTSKKVVDGRYVEGSYTASFVGFFPVEDPQIVCLVMMDNPRSRGYYGGATSGPIFRSIAERVLQTSSRFFRPPSPDAREDRQTLIVPDVRSIQRTVAEKILDAQGLRAEAYGSGDFVVRQSPDPGTKREPGDIVKLALQNEPTTDKEGRMVVPNVVGMSVRRAINRLTIDEFEVSLEGSGTVVQQVPRGGEKVLIGSRVRIRCEPRTVASATLY